jgi:signal transduction histidine kinase
MARDNAGDLWIAQNRSLVRIRVDGVEETSWAAVGHNAAASSLVADRARGGVWLGFRDGGIAHYKDGHILASFSSADGFPQGYVYALRMDSQGTLWAATQTGLAQVRDGHIATLTRKNGLPCETVHWAMEAADGSYWVYMACGLLRIAPAEVDSWKIDAKSLIRARLFDVYNGVRSEPYSSQASPVVASTADGKLWFRQAEGVSIVDPRHLPFNKLAPPVYIEQVVADRTTYDASAQLNLPPLVRDLEIQYSALSLVAPEKMQFKYKLEGRDRDWQDAANRRRATYTDLPPGNYRFRVIAANNSGVWNEQGATLDFSIAPAYWQTNWFRALVVLALLALAYTIYRFRVTQIARHFNATLDARVNERTRIARELHDTLLQSFHGLLLRFQTARALLPTNPAKAADVLDSAIDQAADAITEGRDAVQGLRISATEMNDLADAIRSLGEGLAKESGNRGGLRVEVQGASRPLHPIVRDEVFRIATEALRNAFKHASAELIEVELRYDERQIRLRVRDDGKGIDSELLRAEGREGHFGLRGMRERAELVGGKLTVWSGLDAGTELELSIPASRAYSSPSSSRSWISAKIFGQGATSDS